MNAQTEGTSRPQLFTITADTLSISPDGDDLIAPARFHLYMVGRQLDELDDRLGLLACPDPYSFGPTMQHLLKVRLQEMFTEVEAEVVADILRGVGMSPKVKQGTPIRTNCWNKAPSNDRTLDAIPLTMMCEAFAESYNFHELMYANGFNRRVMAWVEWLDTDIRIDHARAKGGGLVDEYGEWIREGTPCNVSCLQTGLDVIAKRVEAETSEQLFQRAVGLADGIETGAVLVGANVDGQPRLVCIITESAHQQHRLRAGDLINTAAAHINGRGGGRPTLAQARGTNSAGLQRAVDGFEASVRAMV